MQLYNVDLNLFVILDAIYRERSVTQAATQLNLTQPAVSNALNRLRQTFDDQLFVRTPDGMVPTPIADNVIVDVQRALGLLGKSVGVSARFDPATSVKTFHLGMNDLSNTLLLPSLQDRVSKLAPHIIMTSYDLGRPQASEELKSGRLDLLIEAPAMNTRELEFEQLIELPYTVAMRPDHPLVNKSMTMARYLKAQHIHVSSRRKGRGQVDIGLHAMGQKRKLAMRVQSYLVAAHVTARTDLLWTVPRLMAQTTPLSTIDPPFNIEPLSLHLYWHRSSSDDPASRWMRQQITEVISNVIPGR